MALLIKELPEEPKEQFGCAGAILTFSNRGASNLGIILLVGGLVWLTILFFNKTYVVQTESASGHSNALESRHKDFILNVVGVLGEAIVYRG